MLKPAAEPESHSSSAHRSRRGDSQPSSSPKLRGCFAFSSRHFESSTHFGLVCAAARSAELCAAHLRAKHLGLQQGQYTRNSGQRAGSRSCTRRVSASFYSIRPGPNRRVLRDNDILRVCLTGGRQVILTAEGIGV
jgi:hypothetical protein